TARTPVSSPGDAGTRACRAWGRGNDVEHARVAPGGVAWHDRCSFRSRMDQGGFRVAHRKALVAASLVAVAGLAVLTPSTADARPRGRFRGGVVVGGFYDPFYYNPFYSPFG